VKRAAERRDNTYINQVLQNGESSET